MLVELFEKLSMPALEALMKDERFAPLAYQAAVAWVKKKGLDGWEHEWIVFFRETSLIKKGLSLQEQLMLHPDKIVRQGAMVYMGPNKMWGHYWDLLTDMKIADSHELVWKHLVRYFRGRKNVSMHFPYLLDDILKERGLRRFHAEATQLKKEYDDRMKKKK